MQVSEKLRIERSDARGGGGQDSNGQQAAVSQDICQEIFSALTSSSGVLSYERLVQWKYKQLTCSRWNPSKDSTGHCTIKMPFSHQS